MNGRVILLLLITLLSGCARDPLRITASTSDQLSICRETGAADFDEAEQMAAEFCGARGLLPQLAGTNRCSRTGVRYDYICRMAFSR
jgi:hypothetical protein